MYKGKILIIKKEYINDTSACVYKIKTSGIIMENIWNIKK